MQPEQDALLVTQEREGTIMRRSSRRQGILVSFTAVLCLLVSAVGVQAQEEIATAGNGGTAEASANGGAVAVGDVNSGGNAGHAIGVGDTVGGVAVDGGAAANATSVEIAADGGTAIADASGGDDNVAFAEAAPQVCIDQLRGGVVCSTEFKCFSDPVFERLCMIPNSSLPGFNCAPVSELVLFCSRFAGPG